MSYGIDRILPPIEIETGGTDIVITEDGVGTVTVSLSTGRYWAHKDSALEGLGYSGLYKAIEDALNASALTYTYSVDAATPTRSTEQIAGGLRLSTSAGDDFSIDFTSGSWTLPVGLLGMVDNAAVSKFDVGGGDHLITLPYTRGGEWILYNLYSYATRGANDKRSDERFMTFQSDPDSRYAYSYDWSHDSDGDKFRAYEVDRIPAAHVRASRALDLDYCETGQLAYGDENNAFVEVVWERARTIESDSTKGDVIIVHNSTSDLLVASHDYDIVRFDDRSQRASWLQSGLFTLLERHGEYYRLDAKFRIKSKNYSH